MVLFRKASRVPGRAIAKGKSAARAYAVGDIHGCLEPLDDLLTRIQADIAARPPKKNWVVFLGDLIDRGPQSAGVIERLRTWSPTGVHPVFLAGNHEDVFLRVLAGDTEILPDWLRFGGAQCVESYGVDAVELAGMPGAQAIETVRAAIPPEHVAFVESFSDTFRFGDYLFVHAGIRPGIELELQEQFDLRWIREPFLSHDEDHDWVVVHGHTIVDSVDRRRNRIGLDTGAYQTGILTALGIEDEETWLISTGSRR